MRGLKDKRVLITGGAGGIGAATALRFLEEGARVVVLDRDEQLLKTFEDQHPELSGAILATVRKKNAEFQKRHFFLKLGIRRFFLRVFS